MKLIYNKYIPFPGFKAINLFGIIFVRRPYIMYEKDINHELIHTEQMKELGYIFFYIFYFLEWLIKLLFYGSRAYYNISFEREAFENQYNLGYRLNRKRYNWIKKII